MFEKFTSGILKPAIVTSESQQNLRPLMLVVVVVSLLFGAISGGYYIYRKSRTNQSPPKQTTNSENTAVTKSFSFKTLAKNLSQGQQEERQEVPKENIRLMEPVHNNVKTIRKKSNRVFAKYKSIPTNNSKYQEDEAVTPESFGNVEDESAVIARSIAIDPDFLLQEGTYIPCSLTMRFVSEVAGRIQCMINQDIYGASGRVKLIERGTKAIGIYQSGTLGYGMARMHVIWTKLLTPDHKRVNLVDTHVVGRLGEAGIDGRVNSHFAQRFGGALMVSMIKDVVVGVSEKHAGNRRKNTININTFENTKDSTTAIVERMLDASINIPPTMYKKQGDIIGIEVGKDIDFSKIYHIRENREVSEQQEVRVRFEDDY